MSRKNWNDFPLLWISTPSHGYLRVEYDEVAKVDKYLEPFVSDYSFIDPLNRQWVYLEEDCDAPKWLKHLYGENWQKESRKIKEFYSDTHIQSEFSFGELHD